MRGFRGSTALVTGASSGIGEELARLLARQGCRLVLTARRRDRLDALAGELAAAGATGVHVLAADLAVPGAAARLVEQLDHRGLSIDLPVNNAGFGASGAFVETDLAALQSKYDSAVRNKQALITRHKAAVAQQKVAETARQLSAIDPTADLSRMELKVYVAGDQLPSVFQRGESQ